VSAQRSLIVALQNRLENSVNALGTASENSGAAESRIRDADLAAEMSGCLKENVKAQAAQSMLAQANARAGRALDLLRQ
jgi:flagellin